MDHEPYSSCACGVTREECIRECRDICLEMGEEYHYRADPQPVVKEQTVDETQTLPTEVMLGGEITYTISINNGVYDRYTTRAAAANRILDELRDMGRALTIDIAKHIDQIPAYLDRDRAATFGPNTVHLVLLPFTQYPVPHKIAAIKLVRELTGLRLKDAKDAVERELPIIFGPLTKAVAGAILDRDLDYDAPQFYVMGDRLPESTDSYLRYSLTPTA